MTPKPLYKASAGTGPIPGGSYAESAPSEHIGDAIKAASEFEKKYTAVTILIDRRGADHPDNSGKFFLHRIIK